MDTGGIVAFSGYPVSFSNAIAHNLQVAVQGNQLQVALDGKLLDMSENGLVNTAVTLPVTAGSDGGAAGVLFGDTPNPGQITGQRANNLVISTYASISGLPVQDNFHQSPSTAAYVGVGPGIHLTNLSIRSATEQDWYQFQLLRPDVIDVTAGFLLADGQLALQVYASPGTGAPLATGTLIQGGTGSVAKLTLSAGDYYIEVSGVSGATNTYSLSVNPDATSTTTVYYVNDGSQIDDYYTLAPGNDANNGTSWLTPKATVQSVIATYALGPNSLIVVDTGTYKSGTITLGTSEQGIILAGSPGGSLFSYSGTALQLNNADQNVIYGLQFSGNSVGIDSQASGVNTSTANAIENDTFQNDSEAIYLDNGGNDTIEGNTITGGSYGIYLSGWSDSETISQNTISGASTAIYASAGSAASILLVGGSTASQGNVLSNGAQGIYSPNSSQVTIQDNTLSAFTQYAVDVAGVGAAEGNQVSQSGTGIDFSGTGVVQNNQVSQGGTGILANGGNGLQVLDNQVTNNVLGIAGSAILGGNDWSSYNEVDDNETGISASSGAAVAFNRVIGGAVGILVYESSNVSISHEVVAGTTQDAIHVQDSSNVTIQSNTLYVPTVSGSQTANGVVLDSGSSSVALQNNIIWNQSGYDIYVANNSQQGFSSDYNNLFVSGTGMIAWWQTNFLDLYDWQSQTLFDTHSIGYTTLAPTLDNPQFLDAATNDYQLTPLVSTSIAAGNPAGNFNLQNADTGGRIELGAYGDTPLAAQSQASFISIDAPNFYRDWLVSQSNTVLWHSFGLASNAQVLVNLLDANGNFLQTLTADSQGNPDPIPASQGYFAWSPAAGLSGSQYRIQITVVGDASVTAESREAFSLVSPSVTSFYLDPAGSNRNTGTSSAAPKSSLLALLGSYRLQPGDTVNVDAGTYPIVRNVVIGGQLSLGGNEGFTLTGPANGAATTVFNRGNTSPGSLGFDINDALYVTIENITVSGGVFGDIHREQQRLRHHPGRCGKQQLSRGPADRLHDHQSGVNGRYGRRQRRAGHQFPGPIGHGDRRPDLRQPAGRTPARQRFRQRDHGLRQSTVGNHRLGFCDRFRKHPLRKRDGNHCLRYCDPFRQCGLQQRDRDRACMGQRWRPWPRETSSLGTARGLISVIPMGVTLPRSARTACMTTVRTALWQIRVPRCWATRSIATAWASRRRVAPHLC